MDEEYEDCGRVEGRYVEWPDNAKAIDDLQIINTPPPPLYMEYIEFEESSKIARVFYASLPLVRAKYFLLGYGGLYFEEQKGPDLIQRDSTTLKAFSPVTCKSMAQSMRDFIFEDFLEPLTKIWRKEWEESDFLDDPMSFHLQLEDFASCFDNACENALGFLISFTPQVKE